MAWSWSHTDEAYRYAESELRKLPREIQAEILAEWKAYESGKEKDPDDFEPFDEDVFHREFALLKFSTDLDLADSIWSRAEVNATCDNGGYNAWMCPYGCGPHCVDFGPEDGEEV